MRFTIGQIRKQLKALGYRVDMQKVSVGVMHYKARNYQTGETFDGTLQDFKQQAYKVLDI